MVKIKESVIQGSLVKYINNHYPSIFVFSIPNEAPVAAMGAKGSIIYLNKMRYMGMKKGMPDLCILHPAHGYLSYWQELKAQGKKPTDAQLAVHEELRLLGHKVDWFDNLLDAIAGVDAYLKENIT